MGDVSLPWLILPARSLDGGKSRLRPAISNEKRRDLNVVMLRHMLDIARTWPGIEHTVVVSGSDEVLALARDAGALTLRQPPCVGLSEALSETLNAGLTDAVEVLRAREPRSRDIVVASCDLPMADSADLRLICEKNSRVAGQRCFVIATDRHGEGTNALCIPAGAPVSFQFGVGSRRRHAQMAQANGWAVREVSVPGLALDIDTPADLAEWRSTHADNFCVH